MKACAARKAPGPDGLPGAVYKQFMNLLAPMLYGVLAEAQRVHKLPASFLKGQVCLLYKKGNRADVRNYRPKTLLNADYKVYTEILAQRMKEVSLQFTSPEQTGFAPGRFIGDSTHLMKLIQGHMDHKKKKGYY